MVTPGLQSYISAGKDRVTVSVTKALAAAGNYTAADVLSDDADAGTAWIFAGMVRGNGGTGSIVKAVALLETTALTPGLTLFLYSATPSSELDDNKANTAVIHADEANYVGRITFPAMADLGTGDSEAMVTPSLTTGNLPLAFNCAAGATSLFGIVVTRDGITGETAGDELIVKLTVERD